MSVFDKYPIGMKVISAIDKPGRVTGYYLQGQESPCAAHEEDDAVEIIWDHKLDEPCTVPVWVCDKEWSIVDKVLYVKKSDENTAYAKKHGSI